LGVGHRPRPILITLTAFKRKAKINLIKQQY
jgi:hypothetical protein